MTVDRYQEKLLELLRVHGNMTFFELAKRAQLSPAAITKQFKLKVMPSYETMEKISRVFDMTVADFLEEDRTIKVDEVFPPGTDALIRNYKKMDVQQRVELVRISYVLSEKYEESDIWGC